VTTSDRDRLNLYQKLDEFLGTEEANTLMEHLPPVPWNEVATKSDLNALEVALRSDVDAMGTQLRVEMAATTKELRSEMATMGKELRSEMAAMGKELRSEMATMGAELRSEMQAMRFELRAEMLSGFNRQIKWLVTFGMAWSSLLVAVTRFAG
jgi:hypothetical protein